jgi:hypothetical protein
MSVIADIRKQAGEIEFSNAADWLLGIMPFLLGLVAGVLTRTVRIMVAAFVVGYRRGSRVA